MNLLERAHQRGTNELDIAAEDKRFHIVDRSKGVV